MGLVSGVLLLPLLPLRGTVWVAEQLTEEAKKTLAQQHDPRRLLKQAAAARDRGELSQEEFDQVEEELLQELVGPRSRLGRGRDEEAGPR